MVALGSIILPIVSLFCHQTLRQSIIKFYNKKCRIIKSTKINCNNEKTKTFIDEIHCLTNLNGEKLILNTFEATALYFKQIHQTWN